MDRGGEERQEIDPQMLNHTTLFIAVDLRSTLPPDKQRHAAFAEIQTMFSSFRDEPLATDGDHAEIFVVAIRQADGPKEAPD